MTTQARELAGIITNAGDLLFDDDVTLQSDGAVLNFGADSDVTLTHVADTALLLNSTRRLQFGDSGTYINQSADGVLNITSDTEVEINATTVDINANVDVSGNIVLGGTITVGDADTDNMIINANVNSHIIPNTDDTYDLGSSGQQWRNLYINGTAEIDAITVGGVTLSETIADTVGAMTTSNTESGITVAYDDGDNTLDFTVATLNQDTTGTAAIATTVTTADESSDTTCFPLFVTAATGDLAPKSGSNLAFNSSTGALTATSFVGALTGNVTGNASGTALTVTQAAQTAITSVGTLTALTVDNIALNGNTMTTTSTDFTLDASHDIILDADGGNVKVQDNGTTFFDIQKSSNDAQLLSRISDGDLVFRGNDDGSTITALTLDMSEAGAATFTSTVTASGFVGDITGDVTGAADTATLATNITVAANNSTDETVYPTFVDGATGTQGIETDTGLTYNPSSGLLTAGEVSMTTLDIGGTNVTADAAELNYVDGVTSAIQTQMDTKASTGKAWAMQFVFG